MPTVCAWRDARSDTRRLPRLRAPDFCLVFLGLFVLGRALLLVDWTSAPPAAEAAGPPSSPVAVPGTQFSARTDLVQVTVTVFDGRRLVRGLPRDAFQVFEDDVSRPVSYFAAEDAPLELFVAVDVSSSVRRVIGQVKDNAAHFLAAIPATSEVTLVSFNDDLQVLADPQTPPALRAEAVAPLRPYGMTSLYDVMTRSFDTLAHGTARRAIVVFTDGEDTASRVSSETVEERAEKSDALMYVIGHGQALRSLPLMDLCERLAEKSGGRAFFPHDAADVSRAFGTIVDELSAQYLLAYQPRQTSPDGRWHRIRVQVRQGYDVRARQGYRFTR